MIPPVAAVTVTAGAGLATVHVFTTTLLLRKAAKDGSADAPPIPLLLAMATLVPNADEPAGGAGGRGRSIEQRLH
jgi:hypothetical protein